MASFTPRVSTTLFFTLCLVVLMASGDALLVDPDTLHLIAAGDLIRSLGTLPVKDPWSFTAGNYPWFLPSWLWDVTASLLRARWAEFGLVLFTASVCALTLGLLFGFCRERCGDMLAPLFVVLFAAASSTLLARPFCITLLCMVLYTRLLYGYAAGRCSARALLVALPALMVLWVNCHGGFLAGFTVIGAYGVQALCDRNSARVRLLAVLGLLCAAATLINPYGIQVYGGALRSLHGRMNTIIVEWQPLKASLGMLIGAPLPLLLVAFAPPKDARFPLAERLLAYAWLLMGLNSIRHLPLFYIVAAPMISVALDRAVRRREARGGWPPLVDLAARLRAAGEDRRTRALAMLVPAVYLAFVFTPAGKDAIGANGYRTPQRLAEEIGYIGKHYPRGRFIIHYNYASYVIYATRGAIPVFIDSRADTAYPPEVEREYVAFVRALPGWEDMLDKWKITGVLIPSAASRMDPVLYDRFAHRVGWRNVLETPYTALFIREK